MNGVVEFFRGLGPWRIASLAGVAVGMGAFFFVLFTRLSQPPMALLYGNLDLQEAGQITTRLEAAKVSYQLAGNGTQVLVPEDEVLRLRMQLAETGLPTGGSVGYEIFDRADALGTTNFVQNINHVRALEGELARTIRSIDGVQNARVHLVLPRREVFSRESREPSAAIVLKTRGGRIDKAQVRAIQNLVAAAVPDLKPTRISVVDDRGVLHASGADERDARAGAAATLADMRAEQEARLKRAVETLLERSVGPGNVRAEVTADIDFDRITTNSESFDPDGQVIRSTQSIAEQNQSAEAQPQNVTVGNNLPEGESQPGPQSQSRNQRTEEVVNYEISKTVKTQVREAGIIRRLSVAVLVNGVQGVDADGKPTYTARDEDELKQLAALARSAIGYDEKRGDKVEVVNMRFAGSDEITAAEAEPTGFLTLTKRDYFRIIELTALTLIGILGLLFVVRPMVSRLLSAARLPSAPRQAALPPGAAQALTGPDGTVAQLPPGVEPSMLPQPKTGIEAMIDIARVEGQVKASSVKKIGEIIDKHPDEAVAIVRNWLYQTT